MAQENNSNANELKRGVLGVIPLAFLVIATAAPLGASAGNTPLIYGFGNGVAAPLDFLMIGILLIIFAVGYAAMSTHVTNAGAFYAYISMGCGKKLGAAAGYVAVLAYNMLTIYLCCAGGYIFSSIFEAELGVHIHWFIGSIIVAAIIFLLGYFGIEGGSKFLMVCLTCEVLLLVIMDVSVLIKQGAAAFTLEAFSFDAFLHSGAAAPGLGVAFAFLSFIGFEATAIFGEEAKNPRKTVPRATYLAVIFVGVVYTLTAWAGIAGVGADQAIAISQTDDAAQLFQNIMVANVHPIMGHLFNWFFLLSMLASWLGAHNMCARYLYSFGRAGLLPKALGKTHKRWQSPHVAGTVQVLFSVIMAVICLVTGLHPYNQFGAVATAIAVVGIMLIELIVCVAIMLYLRKHNKEEGYHYNIFITTIAPIVALVGLGAIAFLVVSNMGLLTGLESVGLNTLFGLFTPIVGAIGFIYAYTREKKGTLADVTDVVVE